MSHSEEWRRSPSFPDYEISSHGGVRRLTPTRGSRPGFILRTPPDAGGYPVVNIDDAPRRVHVLVAEAFIGPIPPGGEVHHGLGGRADNRVGNLTICESSYDHRQYHAACPGRSRTPGELNPEIVCPCGCGERFALYDDYGRPRRYVSGHNPHPAPTVEAILGTLIGGPLQLREIIRQTGLSSSAVRVKVSRLAKQGSLIRVGHGTYALPEEGVMLANG